MTSRPSHADWDVETIRATFFTSDLVSPIVSDEWWPKVGGSQPEAVTRKPVLGLFSAEGPVDNARLHLNVSAGRIDWISLPQSPEAFATTALGPYPQVEEQFAQRLSGWLELPPISINRVALGLVLRSKVPNRVAGYQALSRLLLSVKVDPDKSRDLLYQINRPRKLESIPGLEVNRLSKWGVVLLKMTMMEGDRRISESEFLRLELDINTDKDSARDLNKDKKLHAVFRELQSLGQEIATNGDVQ